MRHKPMVLLLVVLACLALVVSAHAAASPGYQLDWFLPLSGAGGSATSAHYAADFTVGQTAVGRASGTHSQVELGFWAGLRRAWWVWLPFIGR